MKTLKTLFDHRGYYHHVVILSLLLLSCIQLPVLSIVLGVYTYFLYKYQKTLCLIAIGITVLITTHFIFKPFNPVTSNTLTGQIARHDVLSERLTVKKARFNYTVFYDESDPAFTTGDYITIQGNPRKETIPLPGAFNYELYLKSQNISDVFYADQININKTSWHYNTISEKIANYILTFEETSQPYLSMFILGNRSQLDDSINHHVSRLGIAHLFAISGLHVALISAGLLIVLNKTRLSDASKTGVLTIFITFYMLITGFTPSIIRAGSLLILLRLNKHYNLMFTPIDILSIVAVSLLLINPYQIFHTGFQLTFLVSFAIILMQQAIKNKPKMTQSLIVSALAFGVALPITASFQNGFSILTIPLNLIAIPYTMFILLPLTYITFFLPFFSSLHGLSITLFEQSITFIDEAINYLLILVFPHWISIIIYYLLFYLCVISSSLTQFKKRVGILFIYVVGLLIMPYLNLHQRVTFFNVHGDSILIKDRFHQCTMLIDTGEATNNETLITALYHSGIRDLDILFLSHNHADHMGEYEAVIKHFSPKEIITNKHHDTPHHYVTCGNIRYKLYPPQKKYLNENDNSLVIELIINQDRYLFTGDIEKTREMDLLPKLNTVDILKIPHHGSSTSSSDMFLNTVKPELAIITVHPNNRFNHPSESTLTKLSDFNIPYYRTDIFGTIEITYWNAKRQKISPQIP